MTTHYTLDEFHNPVAEADILTWAKWYESADRKVASSMVGDIRISTVFLGLDHGFGDGPPILFETMVFGGTHDQYQDRHCTWSEACDGHAMAVSMVKDE